MDTIEQVHGELPEVRQVPTAELSAPEVAEIRRLLWAAFASDDEGFTEADWEHALGGRHFVLQVDVVLLTPTSPPLDLTAPISCDGRPGDVW